MWLHYLKSSHDSIQRDAAHTERGCGLFDVEIVRDKLAQDFILLRFSNKKRQGVAIFTHVQDTLQSCRMRTHGCAGSIMKFCGSAPGSGNHAPAAFKHNNKNVLTLLLAGMVNVINPLAPSLSPGMLGARSPDTPMFDMLASSTLHTAAGLMLVQTKLTSLPLTVAVNVSVAAGGSAHAPALLTDGGMHVRGGAEQTPVAEFKTSGGVQTGGVGQAAVS
jgi:hypothetical protein